MTKVNKTLLDIEYVEPDDILITSNNLGIRTPGSMNSAIDILEKNTHKIKLNQIRKPDAVLDRTAPYWAVCEPWNLAELGGWRNRISGNPGQITEQFIRQWVDQQADAGYGGIYFLYVEAFGHWFYRPNFTRWFDYDTGVTGADWSTFSANNGDFDMITVIVDQARVKGLQIAIGVGRVGLKNFLAPIEDGEADGSDSLYAGLTVGQTKQLVYDRTRQLIADINAKYATLGYDHVIAYSSGFEPGKINTINAVWPNLTTNSGASTYPLVTSHGKQFWITPAILDLPALSDSKATKEAYATLMKASGASLWVTQDAAGPGTSYTSGSYTGCTSLTVSQLSGYYARFNAVAKIANAAANNFGTGVRFAAMPECWRLGLNPPASLTLSAVSGTSVTATLGAGFVWPASAKIVGRWITSDGGGRGIITARTSDTVVVINTEFVPPLDNSRPYQVAGVTFEGTSHTANTDFNQYWAIVGDPVNDAYYGWTIPAPGASYLAQIQVAAKYSPIMFANTTSLHSMGDTLDNKLPDDNHGIPDFRTKANNLFGFINGIRTAGRDRYEISRQQTSYTHEFDSISVGVLSGGTYSQSPFTVYPEFTWSRALISLSATMYRGETSGVYVNDVTIQLLINGFPQGTLLFAGGKDGVFSGTFTLERGYWHEGLPFTVGAAISYQTTMGHPTLSSIQLKVEEVIQN